MEISTHKFCIWCGFISTRDKTCLLCKRNQKHGSPKIRLLVEIFYRPCDPWYTITYEHIAIMAEEYQREKNIGYVWKEKIYKIVNKLSSCQI